MSKYCRQCGNCCKGMIWKEKYTFEKAKRLADNVFRKELVEKRIIENYTSYLKKIGLPVEQVYELKWDYENKKIIIKVRVGKCRYLVFKDNKAECMIYESRPKECKEYLCRKAKHEMIVDKLKQQQEASNYLKKHLMEGT